MLSLPCFVKSMESILWIGIDFPCGLKAIRLLGGAHDAPREGVPRWKMIWSMTIATKFHFFAPLDSQKSP